MTSILRELARFAVGLRAEDLPGNVRREAALKIMDTVAAGIGAAQYDQIQRVTREYRGLMGQGQMAPVWGQGFSAPLFPAVFLCAMQGHTLELDDVHTASKCHIGTVVTPAAWSVAAMLGASGEELAVAVVAGYEIAARIAMAFGIKAHRKPGWHSTATAGIFGAAAACGKLLGLDEEKMVSALGLAGAQSFGTWAFLADGASCKVLNPARASQSGCEAAFLAKAGMTGPEHVLTSEDGGLFHMMSSAPVPEYATANLGTVWEITRMDNKPYPCCRSTHCGIDAALALREKNGITAEQIASATVDTYLIGLQQCGWSEASKEPHNGPQARFSTPYCVARAFLDGRVGLASFTDEAINAPEAQALLKRVEIREAERFTEAYPDKWGCLLTVHTKDGKTHTHEIPSASGSIDNPLTSAQARAKSVGLMESVIGRERAEALCDTLLSITELKELPDLRFA